MLFNPIGKTIYCLYFSNILKNIHKKKQEKDGNNLGKYFIYKHFKFVQRFALRDATLMVGVNHLN